MSLRGIIDVIIHLESFRNIDLYNPGLYHLEISVYHIVSGHTVSAHPYNVITCEGNTEFLRTLPPEIEDFCFKSQIFYIKFCDEEFFLQDIIVFRTELDLETENEIIIQVNLMYLDIEYSEDIFEKNTMKLDRAVSVSEVKLKLRDAMEGINQFFPVIFDKEHFSVVSLTVHSLPIDFRFRSKSIIESISNNRLSIKRDNSIDLAREVSECLLEGIEVLKQEDIDRIYDKYVRTIECVHDKIQNLIKDWNDGLHLQLFYVNGRSPRRLSIEKIKIPLAEWNLSLEDFANKFLSDIQELATKMCYLSTTFLEILAKDSWHITRSLEIEYIENQMNYWEKSIFMEMKLVTDFALETDQNLGERHSSVARTLRRTEIYNENQTLSLQLHSEEASHKEPPVLFLDVYSKVCESSLTLLDTSKPWSPNWLSYSPNIDFQKQGTHLIILVHGFQGNSFDVRHWRNYFALYRPDVLFLCSVSNEDNPDRNIAEMGVKLSEEVKYYIKQYCPRSLTKISFVGHSLGGVVIRAALPFLSEFSSKMQFFLTLSTPHLGYMYNSSKIIDAGIWLLKKWRRSKCLVQLSMTDSLNPRDCYLYKLSNETGLEWFKHFCLVSSHQDEYAPFGSARIEVKENIENFSGKNEYMEMARNIMKRLKVEKIHRIDVNFKMKKSLNNFIGRAAHIEMLDNEALIQMFMFSCAGFFE
ncbi:unnamed protein product [Blepharisma stoltei]|uniref:DUF676 domain-containing protein n=1 Tax=Blepharisma stoltei TaxID=1481888 RepID=A0AAU9JCD4_9CILI|nr:unnamed protein product [Blepharisma stoltei]